MTATTTEEWFDVTTGAVISGPAHRPLNVYEVQVADGSLRIRA
jgi:nitrite reductase/ring-hydroxylating ferredoxin subunit